MWLRPFRLLLTRRTAAMNTACSRAVLSAAPSEDSWLRVVPRLGIHALGDAVRLDDGVLLQSVANGLFLHADSLRFDTGSLGVNGAAMGSPFTLCAPPAGRALCGAVDGALPDARHARSA